MCKKVFGPFCLERKEEIKTTEPEYEAEPRPGRKQLGPGPRYLPLGPESASFTPQPSHTLSNTVSLRGIMLYAKNQGGP